MFFIIILYANHTASAPEEFQQLQAVWYHQTDSYYSTPFTIAEHIGIFFAVVRKKILTQISIVTRRAIFTTIGIMIRSIRTITITIPAFISPKNNLHHHHQSRKKLFHGYYNGYEECVQTIQDIHPNVNKWKELKLSDSSSPTRHLVAI
jgi:hypothetical protein